MIGAITPKLLLVPLSLGNEPALETVLPFGVAMAKWTDCRERNVTMDNGQFRFFVATYRRGALAVPVVYLRHPSSLRFSGDDTQRLVARLPRVLAEFY
jgi:hypothetical protein